MTHIFSQSELDHYAAIYGGNVKYWPANITKSAQAALDTGLIITPSEVNLDVQVSAALAVPPPSDLLSRRILKASRDKAKTEDLSGSLAANENMPKGLHKLRLAGFAAAALFAISFVVYPSMVQPSEDEAWLEAASELGFDDVYEWVLSEET